MRLIPLAFLALSCGTAGLSAQPQPRPQPQVPGAGAGPTMVPIRRMRAPTPPPHAVGDVAQVPMEMVDGVPVVAVTVAGRPFRFALDTGAAGHGRIRPAVAEALGLAPGETMRAGDGSGNVQERRSFTGATVALGDVRFEGVSLTEMSAFPGRFVGIDGILGRDLFGRHLLSIDYAAGIVSLSRAALPESALAFQASPRGITVPLRIGDETISAIVDTGNSVAPLIVPAVLADRLRSGPARGAGQARTAISTMEMFEADLGAAVMFGAARLPVTRLRYPALGDTANLGSQAFTSGTLVVDQVNSRIAFHPAEQRAAR